MKIFDRRAGTVLLTLAAAAALLAASRPTWVVADLPAGPGGGARTLAVRGSDAAALVPALALVGLAGAVALTTVRSLGRVLAGVLLAVAGASAAAACVAVLAAPQRAADAAVAASTGLLGLAPEPARVSPWPLIALAPALALAGCGVAVIVRGRRWVSTARFEAPTASAARPVGPPQRAVLWDELSRGADPTSGSARAPGSDGSTMVEELSHPTTERPTERPTDQPTDQPTDPGAP